MALESSAMTSGSASRAMSMSTISSDSERSQANSGSVASNWLLANEPDVYLFGSLAEAAAYLGDDAHWPQWEQRYQLAIQQLQNADDRSRWSAAAAAHPAEIQVT